MSNAEAKRIIELEDRGIYGDEARQIIEKENQENQKDLFDIRGLSNIEQVNKITNEGLAFNETFDVNLLQIVLGQWNLARVFSSLLIFALLKEKVKKHRPKMEPQHNLIIQFLS